MNKEMKITLVKRIFILSCFILLGFLLHVKEQGAPFWLSHFLNSTYSFHSENHAALIEGKDHLPESVSFFRCRNHSHMPILLGPYPFTSQVRFLLFFDNRIFSFDDNKKNVKITKETILIKKNMVDFSLDITEPEKGIARKYIREKTDGETIYRIEFHDGHKLEIRFPFLRGTNEPQAF